MQPGETPHPRTGSNVAWSTAAAWWKMPSVSAHVCWASDTSADGSASGATMHTSIGAPSFLLHGQRVAQPLRIGTQALQGKPHSQTHVADALTHTRSCTHVRTGTRARTQARARISTGAHRHGTGTCAHAGTASHTRDSRERLVAKQGSKGSRNHRQFRQTPPPPSFVHPCTRIPCAPHTHQRPTAHKTTAGHTPPGPTPLVPQKRAVHERDVPHGVVPPALQHQETARDAGVQPPLPRQERHPQGQARRQGAGAAVVTTAAAGASTAVHGCRWEVGWGGG